jgi:hypothetical protein
MKRAVRAKLHAEWDMNIEMDGPLRWAGRRHKGALLKIEAFGSALAHKPGNEAVQGHPAT